MLYYTLYESWKQHLCNTATIYENRLTELKDDNMSVIVCRASYTNLLQVSVFIKLLFISSCGPESDVSTRITWKVVLAV